MTRYIDANALKFYGNHIGDEYEDRFHDKQWVHRDEIDNAPTADVVEVVRRKDCVYFVPHETCWLNDWNVSDDFFCATGERSGTE